MTSASAWAVEIASGFMLTPDSRSLGQTGIAASTSLY